MTKKVSVRGAIVPSEDKWIYDLFGMDAVSPKDISRVLSTAESNEDLEVEINSGGGDVFSGSEIYTLLKDYPGNVTTKILGIAASSASIVAMAGDRVLISPTAQIMIHNVSGRSEGDYRDHQHSADILKNANKTISNAYRIKTGMDESKLLDMMNKETWLNPQEALDKGFVDEIMFDNQAPAQVAGLFNGLIPQPVIDKMRNEKVKQKSQQETEAMAAELELLKLKGRFE